MSGHRLDCRALPACFGFALTALAAVLTVAQSSAAPINWGNFAGSTVSYQQVTEDSTTDPVPAVGFFGSPSVTGDSMDFDPNNFAATANGAGGSDTTAASLKFDIVANTGRSISNLHFSEAGDTSLSGFGGDATTSVTADVLIEIIELNGNTATSILVPLQSLSFTPSAGDYQLTVDGTGPNYGTSWTGGVTVGLAPYLPAGDLATKVRIELNNTLKADTVATGNSAFIQKKDADALTITANIPEPFSASLLVIASCAAVFARRRAEAV
jgi:hypothetical protein